MADQGIGLSGTLAGSESPDGATLAGSALTAGQLAGLEPGDGAAGTGSAVWSEPRQVAGVFDTRPIAAAGTFRPAIALQGRLSPGPLILSGTMRPALALTGRWETTRTLRGIKAAA